MCIEKPVIEDKQVTVDSLDPLREPITTTIDIKEGQNEISYEKLFVRLAGCSFSIIIAYI